jgi:deoxycytidylate deaminase
LRYFLGQCGIWAICFCSYLLGSELNCKKRYQDMTAIIYDKRGRVLSIGKNNYTKSHPLQARYSKMVGEEKKIYLHAEIAAIIRCRNLERAHKIFVARAGKDGGYAMAKPCPACMTAIKESGIKIIEHT